MIRTRDELVRRLESGPPLRGEIIDGVDLSGFEPPPGPTLPSEVAAQLEQMADVPALSQLIDLSGTKWRRCVLRDANLSGTLWSEATLEGVDFGGANLESTLR